MPTVSGSHARACCAGGVAKLVEGRYTLEWRPAVAPLLAVFGVFGQLLSGAARHTATLAYSTCKPCAIHSRNRRDLFSATFLGALVLALAAATVGFNGHPAMGITIAVVDVVIVVIVVRALGKGLMRVAYIHGDGTIHLRGISAEVARLAIENRKDAAGARIDDNADDDDDDDD